MKVCNYNDLPNLMLRAQFNGDLAPCATSCGPTYVTGQNWRSCTQEAYCHINSWCIPVGWTEQEARGCYEFLQFSSMRVER